MTNLADTDDRAPSRAVGLLLIATAVASLALLANHPEVHAHSFAEVLKQEAANRGIDALVHGGFIAVLAMQLVCYAIFSQRLRLRRPPVVAGLVFFTAGAAFLAASMVLDGLVTPAIAVRFLMAPDKQDYAKSILVLIGALIGVLMPIGLAFQSFGVAAWGIALLIRGSSRIVGAFGLLLGIGITGALAALAMNPFVLMGAIVGLAVWAAAVGLQLMRQA